MKLLSLIFIVILVTGCTTNSPSNVINNVTYLRIIQTPGDGSPSINPKFLTFWETKDPVKIQQIYFSSLALPKAVLNYMCPMTKRTGASDNISLGYYNLQFFKSMTAKSPLFTFIAHGSCYKTVRINETDILQTDNAYWNNLANVTNTPLTSLLEY